MAIPFILTLPATARFAESFVRAGVSRGLSSRAIERTIRNAGLSISRGRSILPLMSHFQAILDHGANLKFIPSGLAVNTSKLPVALTDIRREFSYNVRVTGQDPTGTLIERNITVSTDNARLSRQEIEDLALQATEKGGTPYGVVGGVAQLQFGVQRADRVL